MSATAESRLWWRSRPQSIEKLFSDCAVERRTDLYLLDPDHGEAGIKLRGGTEAEIKLLAGAVGENAIARSELWVKGSSAAIRLDGLPTVPVHKERRIRLFRRCGDDVEEVRTGAAAQGAQWAEGCSVELSCVVRQDQPDRWWTLAFEAFGPFERIRHSLEMTVAHIRPALPDRLLAEAFRGGYPLWLSGFGND